MTDQSNNQMNAWLRGQLDRKNQGGAPTPAPVAVEAAPSHAPTPTAPPPALRPAPHNGSCHSRNNPLTRGRNGL